MIKYQKSSMTDGDLRLLNFTELNNYPSLTETNKILCVGTVPDLYYIGTDSSIPNLSVHIMIMDLLGPSLEELFQSCKRQFDFLTVA